MRTLSLLALALAAAPLAAQANNDPDKPAGGSGVLPAGWSNRLDRATDKLADVKFEPMGAGLHFTTGPSGIYWRAADAVTGNFHAIARFTRTKAPAHAEAYGLFVGGNDLTGDAQSYVYFLVRADGMYTIRHRNGPGVPGNLTTGGNRNGWVAHEAVAKADSAGKATDQLEVSLAGGKLTFKANGKTVQEVDAAGLKLTGVVGIRMNHNLDVHVDGFAVHKM